jgi:hypothetical protein
VEHFLPYPSLRFARRHLLGLYMRSQYHSAAVGVWQLASQKEKHWVIQLSSEESNPKESSYHMERCALGSLGLYDKWVGT